MTQSTGSFTGRSLAWLGAVVLLLSASAASAQEVETDFDQIYAEAGKPRVIVFMGADFDTLLSDWSLESTAPQSVSDALPVEERLFSGFTGSPPLPPADPEGVDDFHTQLMAHLDAASIRVVDHHNTLRGSEDVGHQEMIHVGRHAEILTELLFVRDPGEANGFAVQIRALQTADGRYLGSRRIAAPSPSVPGRLGWRTGEAIISLLSLNLQR